ncbi:MAG: proline dehydrogenase family protein [Bdellovibrionales bacterium]|nr:proline dehydrogenase family protein [Bdellovibrionales bacterium]
MSTAEEYSTDINERIKVFGKHIFDAIGKEQPGAFNKNYWSGRIMEWSMTQPSFKVNMFRLVDVLPTLSSSESVAKHVNEYLGDIGKQIHGLIGWGLNVNPRSLRAKLTSIAVRKSVSQMAQQFIAGETPNNSLRALKRLRKTGLAYTVDLLGEYSVSEEEAEDYLKRYIEALEVFGKEIPKSRIAKPIIEGHPGESWPNCISVKLSALYSQCSPLNYDTSVEILSERLSTIVQLAKKSNSLIYVDAEDSANNPIIFETYKRVFGEGEHKDFPYPGIVLQAYSKSCEQYIHETLDFAKKRGAPVAVRLVKGAYWDMETISSNQQNWESPLFSAKASSDANYERLSRLLLDNHRLVLPAFGSHNIRSLSHACCYAESRGLSNKDFELQMLYGMAEPIARAFAKEGYLTRLYVPLGQMIPGMGYLVRRLLENTSNESFLRHTFHDDQEVDALLNEPRMTL